MQAARTDASRVWDYHSPNLKFDGKDALRTQILRFVEGIRGKRQNPVTLEQIQAWFRGTRKEFVVAVLTTLVQEGEVLVKDGKHSLPDAYKVVLYRADGSVVDATRYADKAEAQEVVEGTIKLMEPGERVVLTERGEEIDAFPYLWNC